MKELKFRYEMQLQFDVPVYDHHFTLKCLPQSDSCQKIRNRNLFVYPNDSLTRAEDSFGNLCIYGHADRIHSRFEVVVTGEAVTGCAPGNPAEDMRHLGRYRYATSYTRPGETIRKLYDAMDLTKCPGDLQEQLLQSLKERPMGENLKKGLQIMEEVYQHFSYVPGKTNVGTTAEEALSGGCGVCQDYAHLMITLCHMAGIPARYVVGMLEGEGKSHAWVEVCSEGYWYGLDPTNRIPVTDSHIRISVGRDYRDCRINQGAFYGTGTTAGQQQTIRVLVEEKNGQSGFL